MSRPPSTSITSSIVPLDRRTFSIRRIPLLNALQAALGQPDRWQITEEQQFIPLEKEGISNRARPGDAQSNGSILRHALEGVTSNDLIKAALYLAALSRFRGHHEVPSSITRE